MTDAACHPAELCHPEQSERPMHSACGEALRTSYLGPSRKKHAQDGKRDLVEMSV
jgi:hypothetical protein